MDNVDFKRRSDIMRSVKSKSSLEDKVSKELWKKGVRFRKNVIDLFGKPDIAIKKYKIVIFIDSCFWHGCKLHCRFPSSNQEYWQKKIKRNIDRDLEVNSYYASWNIIRIWEHQLKESFENTINTIVLLVIKEKRK